jgi:hypothetical protein
MAKKKLTPYEKAQRQFVRARLQETGKEKSPETRQQFRQRFDTLAAEKEGRTRLAQKLLPGEGAEERRNFKRMLATDLPQRKVDKSSDTTTTQYTPDQIAQMRIAAAKFGPQLSMVQKSVVPPPAGSFGATQKVGSYTGPSSTTSNKSKFPTITNPLALKLSRGLQAVVPGLSDVSQARKDFDKGNILGGFGRLASGTAQTAATVASLFFGGGAASSSSRIVSTASKRPLRPTPPKLPLKGGPVRPIAPKGTSSLPKPPASTTAASTGRSVTVQRSVRLNKKGGVGGQPYGPQQPYGPNLPPAATTKAATTKAATTKAATTKAATTKAATTKAATNKAATPNLRPNPQQQRHRPPKPQRTKGPQKTKEQLDDEAYNVAQVKNRFPGATEKDAPFVAKLNRAQEAIEKQSEGYQNYAKWLRNDQTQATIARLKRKK